MKLVVAAFYVMFILTACSKVTDIKPAGDKLPNATADGIPSIANSDLRHVFFNVNEQTVTTYVTGRTLTLLFDENVNLYLNAESYKQTYAVHLLEDFKSSALNGLSFTTVAQQGNTTLNWVDDNLNNVSFKKVTDTVISNVKAVKINVRRTFTFFKDYDSEKAALAMQTDLLSTKQDSITFVSYCYYNNQRYPNSTTSAAIRYAK